MENKPTVIFDTQIILRALINPHSVCGKLFYQYSTEFNLTLSIPILAEIMNVLGRKEIREKFPRITEDLVFTTYTRLTQFDFVNPEPLEDVSRDPKDDKFLACAQAAGADYIVTEDKDLLVLENFGKILDL